LLLLLSTNISISADGCSVSDDEDDDDDLFGWWRRSSLLKSSGGFHKTICIHGLELEDKNHHSNWHHYDDYQNNFTTIKLINSQNVLMLINSINVSLHLDNYISWRTVLGNNSLDSMLRFTSSESSSWGNESSTSFISCSVAALNKNNRMVEWTWTTT